MNGDPRIPCAGAAPPAPAAGGALTEAGADKAALRKTLLAARRALDPALKARWDEEIGARVLAWWRRAQVPEMGVYWPLQGEPELGPVYAELAAAGVRLALPKVVAPDTALVFARWEPGEAMVTEQFGVQVPALLREVARPPAIVLPCLGFNAGRYRLGYGGGYYDRTLEKAPRPVTLGVAYSILAAQFASAPYDIALDLIITEAD